MSTHALCIKSCVLFTIGPSYWCLHIHYSSGIMRDMRIGVEFAVPIDSTILIRLYICFLRAFTNQTPLQDTIFWKLRDLLMFDWKNKDNYIMFSSSYAPHRRQYITTLSLQASLSLISKLINNALVISSVKLSSLQMQSRITIPQPIQNQM